MKLNVINVVEVEKFLNLVLIATGKGFRYSIKTKL